MAERAKRGRSRRSSNAGEEYFGLDYLGSGAASIHDQIVALSHATPRLPEEFRQAGDRLFAVNWSKALSNLIIFGLVVFGVDLLFRNITRKHRRRLDALPVETANDLLRVIAARFALALAAIAGFVAAGIGPFLLLDLAADHPRAGLWFYNCRFADPRRARDGRFAVCAP
jgi:hypothetical protein